MPFGLQGAPATFQRMMDVLLKGIREYAEVYLDDLVVFSRSYVGGTLQSSEIDI